jgi:hypothetical protein
MFHGKIQQQIGRKALRRNASGARRVAPLKPRETLLKASEHTEKPLAANISEGQFKSQFTMTFLATWAATQYDHACASGQQERLETPPVEDAVFLADAAWLALQTAVSNSNI